MSSLKECCLHKMHNEDTVLGCVLCAKAVNGGEPKAVWKKKNKPTFKVFVEKHKYILEDKPLQPWYHSVAV